MPEREHFVPCQIRRGGFSSERTFEIQLPDDQKLVGLSYVAYLLDANKTPLGRDVPAPGEAIEGYVQCRVLREIDENTVLIEVPSSDVIRFPMDTLAAAG